MSIYLTVIVKAMPEHHQEIKILLYNLPELSKKEEACLEYDVHQSIDDESNFIINEKWESLDGVPPRRQRRYRQRPHLVRTGRRFGILCRQGFAEQAHCQRDTGVSPSLRWHRSPDQSGLFCL